MKGTDRFGLAEVRPLEYIRGKSERALGPRKSNDLHVVRAESYKPAQYFQLTDKH